MRPSSIVDRWLMFNRLPYVVPDDQVDPAFQGGVYMGDDVDSPTIGEGAFAQTWSSAQMSNVARENRHEAAKLASMLVRYCRYGEK